ncbi:Na(+)/H(+) antiporter [Candidatus Methanoplasma termitum]|uniref:KefB3 protein n=1 Tax=Candidatus Methanoplasma termitum TaxID=1577791 RepID=A0A0A7LCF9_9ARCH|nr:cation:proton antiporter [Candidatus Methanoplasma termitum]AIZ56668.1 Na(+)/H(+) antiporter [Candidatus Methanoplasma termitum]MCL2333312.1 cation:proton antiporter [Candidatus Methanoplasma sp.]
MDFGSILIMLVVLIVLARIGSYVFDRFGVPGLIGEIIVGIIIANLIFGEWSFLGMLSVEIGNDSNQNYEVVKLFAELGVIFLLFSIGLETKVRGLLSVGKAATLVATMGVIIPFVAGFALIQIYDGNLTHALFLGAALVATSVSVTARVIKDMNLVDTKEARIIIGAAVIDDVQGMVVLAIVVGMTATGESAAFDIALTTIEAILFVLLAIAAALWGVPRLSKYFNERKEKSPAVKKRSSGPGTSMLIIAIVVCLGLSWLSDLIGLAAIVGAFFGGMLLADKADEWNLKEKMEPITALFISFFFLNVGMQVNLGSLDNGPVIILAVVIILLAIATKYIGCSIGARVGDRTISKGSRNIIGMGMVPRGEVGMIVASIGLASGVMSSEIYGAVIVMAVSTTIIAPPLLAWAIRKEYGSTRVDAS